MNTNIILEVENLRKVYGSKVAVDDVSFSIKKGEVVGLIGPNGAGKSTIMKALVGMIPVYEGAIRTHSQKEGIFYGAVIEEPGFYLNHTGQYNLEYLSRATGNYSKEEIMRYVKLLDMEQAMKQKVRGYSLGMKQRLGIIQALINNQEFLILDEPTNGLDPIGISDLRKLIRVLAEEGITILISSHILREIEDICDRFIMINNGKIIDTFSRSEMNILQWEIQVERLTYEDYEELKELFDPPCVLEYHPEISTLRIDNLQREYIPSLVRNLTERDVDIFSITQTESLEQRFMQNVEEDEV